ncbi:MAG: HAD family hydrolase [Exilispira sp.]
MKYRGAITFDIDGTLLSTNSQAKSCYLMAFKQTFEIEDIDEPVFKGGIDLEILKNLCKTYKINLNNKLLEKFINNFLINLENKTNINNWLIYNNVERFLSRLKDMGFLLYIVSGNFYKTGLFKLEKTNLCNYFDFLSLNEREFSRLELMKKAKDYAKENNLNIIAHFGDSYHDIMTSYFFNIPSFLFIPDIKYENYKDFCIDLNENLLLYDINQIFDNLNYFFYIDSLKTEKIYVEYSQNKNKENKNILLIFNSYKNLESNFENIIKLDIFNIGG